MLQCIDELHAIFEPIVAERINALKEDLAEHVQKIREALAPEDASINDFCEHFSTAKLSNLRNFRQKTKQAWDRVNNFMSLEGRDIAEDIPGLLTEAKHQTIKWSFTAFLKNPEIRARTIDGVQLRKQLKSIWLVSENDERVCEYLGEALTKEIATLTDPAFGKTKEDSKQAGKTGAKKSKVAGPTLASIPAQDGKPAKKARQ